MSNYAPPFKITAKIVSFIAEISERIGRYTAFDETALNLRLRRINRIRTIRGSLAIEGNTLTEEQITAILEGKRVIAPLREIQEVRNAIKAYDQAEYYAVLNQSKVNMESSVFIEFILRMILDAIKQVPTPEVTPEITPEVKKMLLIMDEEMTRKQIQAKLGLKDEKHFREKYRQPAIAQGLIEMTVPGKPNSRLQKYRITPKGVLVRNG